ncbi:MAG: hypothetical protein HOO94_08985 [Novosphingobium sp.]|nr:hypothetical protein [Novosphingobium sp.]
MIATASPPSLLATGFVVDRPEEGTLFPSAGGNSGSPQVQAIYWRCLTALFASARITNPNQRLALFTNADPPQLGGIDIGTVLARYGVELHRVSLTTRLAAGRGAAWGNVLYFFDILAALEHERADLRFALVDSDVLVTAALDPLFVLLDGADYAGYVVDTGPDEAINGLTRRRLAGVVEALTGRGAAPVAHFGGELFAAELATWRRDRAVFADLLDQAQRGEGPAADLRTEEHIWSVAFAMLGVPVADAQQAIKRIWTSPRFSNAAPGDERLPLWHLPAEKRYGLHDLFRHLARRGFPVAMEPGEFQALAVRLCGVPRKPLTKVVHDGLRQVAAKLGLRQ